MGACGGMAPDQAAPLLRLHAGPGGRAAADHLDDPMLAVVSSWLVLLTRDAIHITGFAQDEEAYHAILDYDEVRPSDLTPGRRLVEPGPSVFDLALGDGEVVRVFGKDGKDTAKAAALVSVVTAHPGTVELAHPAHGGRTRSGPRHPGTRDRLARQGVPELPDRGRRGHTILAADPPRQAAWPEGLLRSPGLRELRLGVRRELTGEDE